MEIGICDICKKQYIKNVHNQIRCSTSCKKEAEIKYNKTYHSEYYQNNSDYVKLKVKEYRQNNREKYNEQKRNYLNTYREKVNKRMRSYKKIRRAKDVDFKLRNVLSRRIQVALKRQFSDKAEKTIKLLGCTIQEARTHLEKQFQKGMNWSNYGTEWHIDHRIPCSSFNLSNIDDQKSCFNFTNLQPLWAKENMKKGNKIIYLI